MKIFLTLLCLVIADFLFAQQNPANKKNAGNVAVQGVSTGEKRVDKKVHYVDKRKRESQSISRSKSKSCSQIHKKSVPVQEKSKNKVLSK